MESHSNLMELQVCKNITVSTGTLSHSSQCVPFTHTHSHNSPSPPTSLAHIIYLLQPCCDQVVISDSPTSSLSLLFLSTRGVCCSQHTRRSPTAPRRRWREVQIDPECVLVCVCWSKLPRISRPPYMNTIRKVWQTCSSMGICIYS